MIGDVLLGIVSLCTLISYLPQAIKLIKTKKSNDLTNMFLVFAEDEAKERHVMTMKDWINATDDLLKFRRKEVLQNSGNISHKQAVEKAENEYEKYRVMQDQKYISSMDEFYNKYLEENKSDK